MTNKKKEFRNPKMNTKKYDLEDRTLEFAKDVRSFVKTVPRTTGNIEDSKQVVRSSGSVGANYIEANESLSRRDFRMRIKISRKEAKESAYWLKIMETNSQQSELERQSLEKEASELTLIFGSIIQKTRNETK